jgi:uncharacterized membrane protein
MVCDSRIEVAHHHLTPSTGKQWHDNKSAFRPRANQSSWEKRTAERKALAAVKAKEKELKDEKEQERQVGGDSLAHAGFQLTAHSDESMRSRRSALPRKRKNDSRRWRRRCTRSVSSG